MGAMKLTQTLVFCLAALSADFGIAAEPAPVVGRRVDGFTLPDYRGKLHSLGDFDQKYVVIAFLGTECPLAKLYGPRLAELARQFASQDVALVGINSNCQDSLTEIAAYARIHKLEFPLLKDAGNQVADQLGAVRTPEVFVLDSQRIVRYWGRIDDQYGVGYIRDEPTRSDLKVALQELLAGQPVSQPMTESVGCHIGRVKTAVADSDVTYSNQIARILQRRCVECHRSGEIAPFALQQYDEVVGWAEMIAEVVRQQRMPPWHASGQHGAFRNDRRLAEEEKELIYRWVDNGAPEGDPAQLPEPAAFTSGWQLPREPDLVIPITEEPYRVQAEGEVRYQYFQVDPGFKEDKWISAAQLLPGNRAVVHHILAFARTPGARRLGAGGGADGFLVGYVPGLIAEPFPEGMAKRIPAGSRLVFQMHYTPIGSVQFDQSKLGLVFVDPDQVTHEVRTASAVQRRLNIPPHAENHEVTSRSRRSPDGALLLSMMPHMHLRGKSFRYELIAPDNAAQVLLDIPRYDFNWQTSYRLSEPLPLPSGAAIHCVAHFDNSEFNLSNPDPSRTVHWGDQTWEEMMIGYFDIALPRGQGQAARSPNRVQAERLMERYDENNDGRVTRSEVPLLLRRAFDRLDSDDDQVLTVDELEKSLGDQQGAE